MPRSTRAFGPIAAGCPFTTSEPTPAPLKSPDVLDALARACAEPRTAVAVTSPWKSESEVTSAEAFAVASWPGLADAEATEPPQETTSMLGKAPAFPKETESTGAATTVVAAPAAPGTTTLSANACAVAPPSRAADSAPAIPGASASGRSASAIESRFPTERLILAQASTGRPTARDSTHLRMRIVLTMLRQPVAELELPADVRLTPQRRAVLDAVERQAGSFTVVQVYDRARRREPSLGLATVYRTIELLRTTGSIRQLAGAGEGAYVRCHPGHHHHLVCVSCGAVEETELCGAPSAAVLQRRHGFRAESHELDVYGLCARCA